MCLFILEWLIKKGFERPGYYVDDGPIPVQKYDWYGYYGREKNTNTRYVDKLSGDYKFEFSDHHNLVRFLLKIYFCETCFLFYVTRKYFLWLNFNSCGFIDDIVNFYEPPMVDFNEDRS